MITKFRNNFITLFCPSTDSYIDVHLPEVFSEEKLDPLHFK